MIEAGGGIRVDIAGGKSRIEAGSTLEATINWSLPPTADGATGEITVLWQTEGKGDTDRGIVHFEEVQDIQGIQYPLRVKLPLLPLTYHGKLLKIHWLVRVRLKPRHGREMVTDTPFTLVAPGE